MGYHVAFEGFDGVGKSSAAKAFAKEMGWYFVEKPLAAFTDPEGGTKNYRAFVDHVNKTADLECRALIYGAGTYITSQMAAKKNITTDRHLCSMYSINYTGQNEAFFDYLIERCGKPTLTVILHADSEVRRQRILKRNPNDPDLKKVFLPFDHIKLVKFVERYDMPHIIIDNTNISIDETVQIVKEELKRGKRITA